MNINYYRDDSCNEGYKASWQNCQFNNDTDLTALTVKPLVTINSQPFIRQHHITYLTGRETCHAHHFAKLLATKLLASPYTAHDHNCKVLWIDSVHGPHICAKIFQELRIQRVIIPDITFCICLLIHCVLVKFKAVIIELPVLA